MYKIEDIKPKDYKKLCQFNKVKLSSGLRISFLPFLFIFFILSLNINLAAAPLSSSVKNIQQLSQVKLDPETQKKKDSLESELKKVLEEINRYKKNISDIKQQKRTIQNEISLTESQIKKTELEIQAINLTIKKLDQKIAETKKSIKITEEKIEKSKEFLTNALRYYYQLRQRSVVEFFLAQANLSDYFSNFFYLQKLQESISDEINNLEELNKTLNKQKIVLDEEMNEQNNLLYLARIKHSELQGLKKEKEILLADASKKETQYTALLIKSERTAQQIREELYKLAGGVAPISFGEAYRLADLIEKTTGVRAAFLLAILHYESKIGQNVGNCSYKEAMKPSEQPIFEKIVNELGLDPNRMPVSCKPWYGWGGAMGPAQFLPSTWMAYRDKVSKITENNPPSPWNIFDAFAAAAILLKENGASVQSYDAEWKAAMIYFAGSNWNKPSLRFYGDDVMAIAQRFQNDINILKKSQ